MMWIAFESREFRWLPDQEFISIATVMTLSTISSVEEFLSLQASIPIATLALWIILADSSGWFSTSLSPSPTVFPAWPACVEGVSSPSAISCSACRSVKSVGFQQAVDRPSQERPESMRDQTL